MSKKISSRSGLFLLELIISILFFSLASAVCIQLFVKAHLLDKNNRELTHSVKLTENFAEVFTSVKGDVSMLSSIYPDADITTDSIYEKQDFSMYYNAEWNSCHSTEASYHLTVSFASEECSAGVMYHANISMIDLTASDDTSMNIYSLPISIYISSQGGSNHEE